MAKSLLLTPLLLLAACADDPASLGGDVIGSWRALPDSNDEPTDVEQRDVFAFDADGTYTLFEGADQQPEEGTYELSDGRITLMSPEGSAFEVGYFADGDQLMFGVLEPDDDGADAVATWSGYLISNGARVDTTLDLNADTTAHLEQTNAEETNTYDGNWTQLDDDVESSFQVSKNATVSMSGSLYAGFLGSAYEPI